jgi:flagellar hook protein FlgE
MSPSTSTATESSQLNGAGLANAITLALNDQFGDEKFFDFSSPSDRAFRSPPLMKMRSETSHVIKIAIPADKTATTMLPSDIVDAINLAMASTIVTPAAGGDPAVTLADQMTVSYNIRERAIQFKPASSEFDDDISQIRVTGWNLANPDAEPGADGELAGSAGENLVLGFGATSETISVGASVTLGAFLSDALVPNGDFRLDPDQQRSGIKVEYLRDERRFVFKSGTTGEASTIDIQPLYRYLDCGPTGDVVPVDLVNELLQQRTPVDIGLANVRAGQVLGFAEEVADEILVSSGTGLPGIPAITTGSRTGVDTSGTFPVTFQDNVISVTVDGVDGKITIPPGAYTGDTFAAEVQNRVNLIQTEDGRKVSGVEVRFDIDAQRFTFTSGTASRDSFINVNGHPNFGLAVTTQERGDVPDVTILQQARDVDGNPIFVDGDGNETIVPIEGTPNWVPVYLDKGELTFDTSGRLISPKEGAAYTPFDPQNGSDPIVLNVDYGTNSTQFSQPFSVLSLSQDGFPSGKLDGLDIDSSGVVRANYTNGQQVALGKIILTNFANPNGLKQIGDANYLETTNSGQPTLGEAGGDGFGSIQAGALERANVDLTEELVELITAQRNFQANAKAIETSSTLTQTIINIRN